MSNRYRDSMDRLHFTQEQKQEMVDRLMEAGPVSSVRPSTQNGMLPYQSLLIL